MSTACRYSFVFRGWAGSTAFKALGIAFAVSFLGHLGIAADEPEEEKYVAQIFIGNADGSDLQRLAYLTEYQSQGSPSWSQDGSRIAFDAYKPQDGERFSDAHLIVVNSDGGDARDLGRGLMPSLSPRGHRVVYSIHGSNGQGGVWIVDVEDPEKRFQIDANGWGADWSPDGVHVAYGQGDTLILYNVIEGTSERVFEMGSSPVSHVYWNFSWSPDGRQIAFRAMTKDDKTVLAVVDAKSGGQNYQVLYEGESFECVDWTSDGQQIVVPMRDVNRGGLVSLFAIDVEKPSEPRLLENLPIDRKVSDPSFSPDGKQLTVQAFKRAPAAK